MRLSIREMFEWTLHRPLLVIFTTAVITGFFGWQLPNLSKNRFADNWGRGGAESHRDFSDSS